MLALRWPSITQCRQLDSSKLQPGNVYYFWQSTFDLCTIFHLLVATHQVNPHLYVLVLSITYFYCLFVLVTQLCPTANRPIKGSSFIFMMLSKGSTIGSMVSSQQVLGEKLIVLGTSVNIYFQLLSRFACTSNCNIFMYWLLLHEQFLNI